MCAQLVEAGIAYNGNDFSWRGNRPIAVKFTLLMASLRHVVSELERVPEYEPKALQLRAHSCDGTPTYELLASALRHCADGDVGKIATLESDEGVDHLSKAVWSSVDLRGIGNTFIGSQHNRRIRPLLE